MKKKHLCFILDCKNTVVRHSDDFQNIYCKIHSKFNSIKISDYQSEKN